MRPAPARPTGGRAARQKDGPPPAGMRAAPEAHPPRGGRGARRRVSAASTRPRAPPSPRDAEAGPRGRAGFRPPPLPRTTTEAAGRREGPASGSEKSGLIRHECPSLVRRGLGPARESARSPHRSNWKRNPPRGPGQGRRGTEARAATARGRAGGRLAPHLTLAAAAAATVSHNTTQRRSRATETGQGTARKHGGATTAKHAQGRADHASLPLPARPGREPGSKSQPKKPHRTDDRQRVPTNLVVQSADCRHRKDGSRGRGLSADRPRPPGRQARPQATPHHPISPREPGGGGPPPKRWHGPSGRPHAPTSETAPYVRGDRGHAHTRGPEERNLPRVARRRPRRQGLLARTAQRRSSAP